MNAVTAMSNRDDKSTHQQVHLWDKVLKALCICNFDAYHQISLHQVQTTMIYLTNKLLMDIEALSLLFINMNPGCEELSSNEIFA